MIYSLVLCFDDIHFQRMAHETDAGLQGGDWKTIVAV